MVNWWLSENNLSRGRGIATCRLEEAAHCREQLTQGWKLASPHLISMRERNCSLDQFLREKASEQAYGKLQTNSINAHKLILDWSACRIATSIQGGTERLCKLMTRKLQSTVSPTFYFSVKSILLLISIHILWMTLNKHLDRKNLT